MAPARLFVAKKPINNRGEQTTSMTATRSSHQFDICLPNIFIAEV